MKRIKAVTVTLEDGSEEVFEGNGTATVINTGTKRDKGTTLDPVTYVAITIVPKGDK